MKSEMLLVTLFFLISSMVTRDRHCLACQRSQNPDKWTAKDPGKTVPDPDEKDTHLILQQPVQRPPTHTDADIHLYHTHDASKPTSTVNALDPDYPFRNVSLPWATRVDNLVSLLTLEELQLQMARGGHGPDVSPAPPIRRLGVGPYSWNTECLRGVVNAGPATSFPQALGLAATFRSVGSAGLCLDLSVSL